MTSAEPYASTAYVGIVVVAAVTVLVYLVYRFVRRVETARRRREDDAAARNPANCTCRHDRCDADQDWQDYLDGLPSRALCLPCLYRPAGSECYADFMMRWGAR